MKVRILAAAVLAGFALNGAALAAEPPTQPSAHALELAREVIEASGSTSALQAMVAGRRFGIPETVLNALPPDKREKAELFQGAIEEAMSASIGRVMARTAQTYATVYTEQELNDLLAFYRSPTGRALVAKTPELAQQMAASISQEMGVLLRDAMQRYCERTSCTPEERSGGRPSLS